MNHFQTYTFISSFLEQSDRTHKLTTYITYGEGQTVHSLKGQYQAVLSNTMKIEKAG